jgi:hypothetical protein
MTNDLTQQMGGLTWRAISQSSNPKQLRKNALDYKRIGYKTHITPKGKHSEILWVYPASGLVTQ